jgi:uncharacterized protein
LGDTPGLKQRPGAHFVQYPTYDPQSPVTPLAPEEVAALDALLQRLPADGSMSLDGFDGFLSALAMGPAALRALPTSEWLPLIWGGDPEGADSVAPFASKRQRKNTVLFALRHLRHVSQLLHDKPDDWEPIFSMAEQGPNEFADAREWCMGFLQAVDLLPSAWDGLWAAPEVAPLLTLGGGLEGVECPVADADLDDPAQCDELSRAVPDAVLHLLARVGR